MVDGVSQKEFLRPGSDRSVMIVFQGAKLSSDTGFLLMRELDQRHNVIAPIADPLENNRSLAHTKHPQVQMIRQRVYKMAASYEDSNDTYFIRVDPTQRLALGKGKKLGAGKSALSRFENGVLAKVNRLVALEEAVLR